MSERKSTNKYYPPDYDPIKAEKEARKLSKKLKTMNKKNITIRLMTPFSIRCEKCNEFIPKSRKFNARKETLDEMYLGKIRMYKFDFRCPGCNNSISFRTDPRSGDYVMNFGGVRNYIGHQDGPVPSEEQETIEQTLARLEAAEKADESQDKDERDRMEQLENRLAKLQKQQQEDENLEKLAEHHQNLQEKAKNLEVEKLSSIVNQEELDDMIAEEAFQQGIGETENKKEVKKELQQVPTAIPTKVALKRKNKNPLGVVLKKKKKV